MQHDDGWIEAGVTELREGEQIVITLRGTLDDVTYGGIYVTFDSAYSTYLSTDIIESIRARR